MRVLLGLALVLAGCASSRPHERMEVVLPPPSPSATPDPEASAAGRLAEEERQCAVKDLQPIRASDDGTVDVAAVKKAVKHARFYAERCCTGGDSGTVRVSVAFAPAGWGTEVKLDPEPFGEGDTEACVVGSFRRVMVGAYRGEGLRFEESVTIGR